MMYQSRVIGHGSIISCILALPFVRSTHNMATVSDHQYYIDKWGFTRKISWKAPLGQGCYEGVTLSFVSKWTISRSPPSNNDKWRHLDFSNVIFFKLYRILRLTLNYSTIESALSCDDETVYLATLLYIFSEVITIWISVLQFFPNAS